MHSDMALSQALAPAYLVERQLGRGGMGEVYLAHDTALHRPVAIKVLPPEFATDPESRARFLHETRTAASFSHPNIVPVHAVEEREGLLCFVMGFVDGETLTDRVRLNGPVGVGEGVRLLQEVAWALSYAHGRGIVHRDVKPDNIMLERATGRALVTDFGIARSAALSESVQTGHVMGTPDYMSPEQAAGDEVDGRSDLYSLGVVAFFALTGRAPFEGDSESALLAQHIAVEPPRVETLRPGLPDGLVAVVHRLLQKDPADRFTTGEEVVEALDALRASRPDVAPSIRLFLSRAPALVLGAAAIAAAEPALMRTAYWDADRAVLRAMLLALFLGLVWRLIADIRALAEQGFGYVEFKRAVAALNVERGAVREQRKLAPNYHSRQRRRRLVLAACFAISVALLAYVRTHRTYLGEGRYEVGQTGLVIAVISAMILVLALYAVLSAFVSALTTTPLSHRIWTSWMGRAVYRAGAAGVATTATSSSDTIRRPG